MIWNGWGFKSEFMFRVSEVPLNPITEFIYEEGNFKYSPSEALYLFTISFALNDSKVYFSSIYPIKHFCLLLVMLKVKVKS